MKKTLLLCFIHGFKGGDDTFGGFPEQLRALVSHGLPKVDVQAIVYPKFETRGDLAECDLRLMISRLQEKVIDIEVANHTPSPTVDPSVRTILIGHSMGGIVAADTVLALASETAVDSSLDKSAKPELNSFMFPYIQGVLAFDTPYLGISPGVVAHGAEEHYNTATSAFTQLSGLTGALWGGKVATEEEAKGKDKKPIAALPAPPVSESPASPWAKWSKIAMYAGAGAAVAAGGAAAYLNRDHITGGWSWVGSHLEFVGCLMKGEELKKRVSGMVTLNRELRVGFGNLYTRLGKKALSKNDGSMVGSVIGNQRTFCNLPKKESAPLWHDAINDMAPDEIQAHMTMFYPKDNPGYHVMSEMARNLIVEWSMNDWYEAATGDTKTLAFEQHDEL
ncbi:hypothetical protein D0Z07_4915 [Hyphodiscus hymeniophilus]|uniref:DUF676 domain-containing protein n=1 Tax=Hyphodiscus hymeniophilus TaxID=353542 RepID=A0A9P6VIQ7_9HELO|nr:hypothetical protein D0Z07_4915 [Hyphodiscus hymeniophilus]